MQGNSPDEEYGDPHGECAAEIKRLRGERDELLAICKDFVRKVEAGAAKSSRTYAMMVNAIAKIPPTGVET